MKLFSARRVVSMGFVVLLTASGFLMLSHFSPGLREASRPESSTGHESEEENHAPGGSHAAAKTGVKDKEVEEATGPLVGVTWVGLDPPAEALVHLRELAKKQVLSGKESSPSISAAASWARVDPAKAWEWAMGLPTHLRFEACSAVLEEWVKNDPELAFSTVTESEMDTRDQYLDLLIGFWTSIDPESAFRTSGSYARTEAPEKLEEWRDSILRAWAEKDPESASAELERCLAFEESEKEVKRMVNHFEMIGEAYALRNLPASTDWLDTLEPSRARAGAARGVIRYWFRKEPEAAVAWLDAQQEQLVRDEALTAIVFSTLESDPKSAIHWAARIGNRDLRFDVIVSAATSWLLISREEAESFLSTSPLLTKGERREILGEGKTD